LEPSTPADLHALGPAVERWRLDASNAQGALTALAASVRHLLDDPAVRVRDREDDSPRPLRPGDVAILCRRRDTCLALATALAPLDVRSEVARGGLLATPEGRVLSAGLRLWVDRDDLLSRAEIARLTGAPDASLDGLLQGDDRGRFGSTEPIAGLLAARDTAPFAGALEAFDTAVHTLRLDDLTARWGRGSQGARNIDALRAHAVRFVRLARHHGGSSSPAALVGYLEGLASDTDDAQATGGGDEAVKITTWHAAKGLEWPIVVLFELDGHFSRSALGVHVDDRRSSGSHLEAPLDGRTIRYWPSLFPPSQHNTPFHERLRGHELSARASEDAVREEIRLLYVGWTRARDRLVLAGFRDLSTGTLALFTRGGGAALTEPRPPDALSGVASAQVTWGGRDVAVGLRRPPPSGPRPPSGSTTADVLVRPAPRSYPPAHVRPADADAPGHVMAIERIGPPIALLAPADPSALGTAVHAFLAADREELDADDRAELGTRLLGAWSVENALALDDLLWIGGRFSQWLAGRYRSARVRREWPV
ncbi:MAG TPA: 3'-5' exonuclease, partial [Polyangiaceae bacterium]|nr:3'-5' exonuclease [Polyangiaceae bacterium]